MSSAAEQDTVWIGFMDIFPVIGTIKESVELVLALYEGNQVAIKEKEKALKNIVQGPLNKHVKLTPAAPPAAAPPTAAAAAAAAADADEYSGLRNVREVRKEKMIEHIQKVSKWGKKKTAAEQGNRLAINKLMLKNIKFTDKNIRNELKIELKKMSKRNVFHNDIRRFHKRVLKKFKQEHGINVPKGYEEREMCALGVNSLSNVTEVEIEINMVAQLGESDFYVNANAAMYGLFCQALENALLAVLRHMNTDDVTEEDRQRLNDIIDCMNNNEIYVDDVAKVSWIANTAKKQQKFIQVKRDIVQMYKTDRGEDWCLRILHLVPRLFTQRE